MVGFILQPPPHRSSTFRRSGTFTYFFFRLWQHVPLRTICATRPQLIRELEIIEETYKSVSVEMVSKEDNYNLWTP